MPSTASRRLILKSLTSPRSLARANRIRSSRFPPNARRVRPRRLRPHACTAHSRSTEIVSPEADVPGARIFACILQHLRRSSSPADAPLDTCQSLTDLREIVPRGARHLAGWEAKSAYLYGPRTDRDAIRKPTRRRFSESARAAPLCFGHSKNLNLSP